MKRTLEIELSEAEVRVAIMEYVDKHQGLEVLEMDFSTSVRGDYDRGDAEEYVRGVVCVCEEPKA